MVSSSVSAGEVDGRSVSCRVVRRGCNAAAGSSERRREGKGLAQQQLRARRGAERTLLFPLFSFLFHSRGLP